MIVYGKHRKKYVLSAVPDSQDEEGAIYSVPADPDILIKIYQPEYCTPEKERNVIDTVNGVCRMVGEIPVDVVYSHGRFAGYIFENSSPVPPIEPIPTQPEPVQKSALGTGTAVAICIGAALVLSLLIYLIFPLLQNSINVHVYRFNMRGVPMILGGCVLMGFALFKLRKNGLAALIAGLIGYLVGAALICAALSLLALYPVGASLIILAVIFLPRVFAKGIKRS